MPGTCRFTPANLLTVFPKGTRVVLEMTAGLQGHNITCDNFFTSYALGQELLPPPKKKTIVGTVRRNKPELPPVLFTTKDGDRFSSKFAFTDVSLLPKE